MNSIFREQGIQGTHLDVAPFPCCRIHFDGSIVDFNDAGGALLRLDTGTSRLPALQNRLYCDDIEAVLAALGSSDQSFEADCRVAVQPEAFRWFMLRGQRIPGISANTWLCCLIDIDARKARETELGRELRIRNDMLDASVDCIKVITSDGLLTHMNKAGCSALGVPQDSSLGMPWTDLLPESVRASGRAAVAAAKDGNAARFAGSSRLPGEPPRYWDNMLTPLQRKGDEVTSILCMSRDITLQREAEIRLELALRATDDAIWDWDVHTNRMRWNEAMLRCYGYAAEGVGETPAWWLERIHAEDRSRIQATLSNVLKGSDCKYTIEYRFRRADGRYADVRERGYLSRDKDGDALRVVGTMLDQTDRKAIERNLQQVNRALEERANERTKELERLWNTSPDLLLVLGPDGIIRRASPAVRDALGREPDAIVGHHVGEYVMEEDAGLLGRALLCELSESSPAVEVRHRHRDGSCQWIAWVAASSGADVFATGRVVTAERNMQASLRKAEEALHEAQKMEAIGRLTGNVAHDFNNLLHVIKTSVELLRRPDIPAHQQARCVEAISSTADRGARLTSQLLSYGRRSTLAPTCFDVGANIRALRELFGTLVGRGIEIEINETRACRVFADSNQFDTAMINIVANACDAMNRKGLLKIGIDSGADGFVAVSVEDQGHGIPADQIQTIFDPFFTTKPPGQGTGLGLSQVFGFVKQSGGDVVVESTVGVGSKFTLSLPECR
ncbi:PAS domain-containing protein [Burkholderia sp. WSM2230]|uniref:PAS domain-containing protein n=1 Tax=Burkholderia sp. WSM2230 TaxID=944435 RepID=UPI00046EE059|nr:PAS domain-containing protein [Burkholderia sp. WSM2230]